MCRRRRQQIDRIDSLWVACLFNVIVDAFPFADRTVARIFFSDKRDQVWPTTWILTTHQHVWVHLVVGRSSDFHRVLSLHSMTREKGNISISMLPSMQCHRKSGWAKINLMMTLDGEWSEEGRICFLFLRVIVRCVVVEEREERKGNEDLIGWRDYSLIFFLFFLAETFLNQISGRNNASIYWQSFQVTGKDSIVWLRIHVHFDILQQDGFAWQCKREYCVMIKFHDAFMFPSLPVFRCLSFVLQQELSCSNRWSTNTIDAHLSKSSLPRWESAITYA